LKWIFGEFLKMWHFCHILRKIVLGVSGAYGGLRKRPTIRWKGLGIGEYCVFKIVHFWRETYFWHEIQK